MSSADKKLVIVESPTKARTIRRFLPDNYEVEASMGHVRDLPASAAEIPARYRDEPWARLGVQVNDGFKPLYVVAPKKKQIVNKLKKLLESSSEVYIATDEDREGESIGWHLVELLEPKIPIKRMVFHEITEDAILRALDETRQIDRNLVDAQETRRVLDRLVGYTVSPLLWRKIAPRLSAGRVQSVAVRLLVMREKERLAFVPAGYWDLKARLSRTADERQFDSVLTHVGEHRVELPFVGCPGQAGLQVPVAGGHEGQPFLLAHDQQPDGHALHASGGEARGYLAPQQRRDGVAHEPVQDPAGFLGVDQVAVNLAGFVQGAEDGVLGDLVEHHSLDRYFRLEQFDQVPADRFALAILIRRDIHFAGRFQKLFQLVDYLFLLRGDHVERLEAVVHLDAQPGPGFVAVARGNFGCAGGKVTNMAHACLDFIIVGQEPADRPRLGGRLHNDQFLVCTTQRITSVAARACSASTVSGDRY